MEIANDYIELLGKKYILGTAYDISERYKKILLEKTINKITQAIFDTNNIFDYIKTVKEYLSEIIKVNNFCFLLHKNNTDQIRILSYNDQFDNFRNQQKLNRKSLTYYILTKKKSFLLYKSDILEMYKKGEIEIIGTLPEVWIGIPFELDDETNAAIVIQDYEDKNAYTKDDMELLNIVIRHIAISLNFINNRNKIEESEEKYRTLFESAYDAIFLIKEFIIIDCNKKAEQLLKLSKKDILNRNLLDFVIAKEKDFLVPESFKKIIEKEPKNFEWEIEDKTGRKVYCDVSFNQYKIKGKLYQLAVVRDISEKIKFIKELQSSLKIMRFQNEEIFHRVMNNLQKLKSIFRILVSKGNYPAETKLLLDFLKDKTQLMSDILTNIYQHPDEKSNLSLSFNKLIVKWISLHPDRKVKIVYQEELSSNMIMILSSMMIFEMLLSLIDKKLKAEGSDSEIYIKLEARDKNRARIQIWENGRRKVKQLSDLNISKEEDLLLYLFSLDSKAKIEFERKDNKNYYSLIFLNIRGGG